MSAPVWFGCDARNPDHLVCTLPDGHDGPHETWAGDTPIDVWGDQ